MPTIRAVTESCIHSFAVVCHEIEQHTLLDASARDEIREESGRFRVWTGNLGALAKGHSALDWRLRDADVMRSTVLSLLEELQRTLELASALVRGESSEVFLGAETFDNEDVPDDISLPSDDGLELISQPGIGNDLSHVSPKIQDLIRDLYKLFFRIRNSTSKPVRGIYYKEIDASSNLDIFGDCFAVLDENHIVELYRSLRHDSSSLTEDDNTLVQRLAWANTARRRQFRYWQKHAQKLTFTDIPAPAPVLIKGPTLEPLQEPVKAHTGSEDVVRSQASQSQHEKSIFTTTEATLYNPQLDLTPLETQSITSFATTARDLDGRPAELPPPPVAASSDQDFVCPYCYVLCPSRHGKGRAWRSVHPGLTRTCNANKIRAHILRDLSPYICTYVTCATPKRLYTSRREWLEHEDLQHRRAWFCRFHPLLQFPNQESLERHLHDEVHSGMSGDGIRDYASISQSVANDLRLKCPICLEQTSCISNFPAHLAHHMERIATFSLPKTLDEDEQASILSDKAIFDSRTGSSLGSEMRLELSEASNASLHSEVDGSFLQIPISVWLAPDAFSKPSGRTSSNIDISLWRSFINGKDYRAWFAGNSLWRIYCCGSSHDRLATFSSSMFAELEESLPDESIVIALFMPDVPTQSDPAHSFLASLLGQLLVRVSSTNYPKVILDELQQANGALPSMDVIKEALGPLLACFRRVYLILDNVGNYWDNGSLPLWTVVMGPRFANLNLMLTMQTYQNPSMTTTCTVCGKGELLVYWHCASCKGGNFDACSTCQEEGLGCQIPSHCYVLTDVQKEKAVVDVDSFFPHTTPDISFARRIDLDLLTMNQRNQAKADIDELLTSRYDGIFEIISSDPREVLIIKAFDIVYHALRRLLVGEFLNALNVSQELLVHDVSQVVTWTGDLIKVSKDANGASFVQFFDDSLIDYFKQRKHELFPSGHATLALVCLQVLLQEVPPGRQSIFSGEADPLLIDATIGVQPTGLFFKYAACSWGKHLRAIPYNLDLEDMAMRYLENDERLKLGTAVAHGVQPEDMADGFDVGEGLAAVHVCAIFGITNILRRLPSSEFHLHVPVTGRTPLIYACRMGHYDTVSFLLKSGADPNQRSAAGLRLNPEVVIAQEMTARGVQRDTVQLLLDQGTDMNATATNTESVRETPLLCAARMGHGDIVKLLLGCGADPNLKIAGDTTALHEAIKLGRLSVVETLLRLPTLKLTSLTSEGDEPASFLLPLLQLGSLDILRLALARDDLDMNDKDLIGDTVLWSLRRASRDGYDPEFQVHVLRLIVQHPKSDVNAVDLDGRTWIMRFLEVRTLDTKLLLLLLGNGADLNRMDNNGETALFYAVIARYSLEITSSLISHKADLTVKNRWGQSLTHRLVADMKSLQDIQYLDLLLERMPKLIDAQDDKGRTPLHLALVLGKTELAKELLARAADVNLLDNFGRASFDIACQYGRVAILPKLAPVGIYKIETKLEAKHPTIASPVKHSAPDLDSYINPSQMYRDTEPRWRLRRGQSVPGRTEKTRVEVSHAWSTRPLPVDEGNDFDETRNLDYRPSNSSMNKDDIEYNMRDPTGEQDQLPEPMHLADEETLIQEAQVRRITSINPGRALFEMQLNSLPAWSLGYLGRFDKLLASLQDSRIDLSEQSPDDGNTALHTIIKSPPTRDSHISALRMKVFRRLLAKVKPDCNQRNASQETPLHTAILGSQIQMAITLIEAGAELDLHDDQGRSPLYLAGMLGHDRVVAAIEDASSPSPWMMDMYSSSGPLRRGQANHSY